MRSASTHPSATTPRFEARLIAGLWIGFSFICLLYALFAFDYFISFATERPGLWLRFMAASVSDDFTFGRGSVHLDQHEAYSNALRFMLMHTTMAAVAMALGPFQFMRSVRLRVPRLHRVMGRIYLGAVVLSMFGSFGYLGLTGLENVYSGPAFGLALWGLDFIVLATGALALRAILRREVSRHRAWMAINFSLLLTAPGLRILWVAYGIGLPQYTQAESNLAITTYLLPACLMVGLLWLSFEKLVGHREPVAVVGSRLPVLATCLGAVALVVIANQFLLRFLVTPDLAGRLIAAATVGHEQQAFAAHWPWFVAYVVAMAMVLFTGPAMIRDPDVLRLRFTPFFLACVASAVTGAGVGMSLGVEALGGQAMMSYWWGLGVLWLMGVAMAGFARSRGAWLVVRDWVVFSYGIALSPLVWFGSLPLLQALFAISAQDLYLTGAVGGLTVFFLLAHYANVEVLEGHSRQGIAPAHFSAGSADRNKAAA